jgi:DNA-binding response OmpR family regulator/PAS domain-containing protein
MSQFEHLLNALDEPVFEMDTAGVVVYATPALAAWTDRDTGYALADALGSADRPRFQQTLQRIVDGKTAKAILEITLVDADGSARPIELKLVASQRESGKTTTIVGWLRDLSMEKAREAAANVQGTHLLDLVDNISDACVVESVDGTVEMVNAAFCELFSVKSATQSLIGTPCSELFMQASGVTDKKVAPIYFPMDSATADEFEFTFTDKRRAKQHSIPVPGEVGVAGRLHIFRLLDAKAKTPANLPALSATDAAQLQLIEKIAHDLATTVEGAGSAIYRAEQLELPGQVLEHFRRVEMSAQSAFASIAGLLDFSKLETSEISLDVAEFHLREGVARMLERIVPSAEERAIQLKLRIEQDVPEHLTGDGARMMLCLRNLLECAMPPLLDCVPGTEISLIIEPEYSADNMIHLSFSVVQAIPKGATRPKSINPAAIMQLSLARQIVRAMHGSATGKAGGKVDIKERKETTTWQFTAAFPYRAIKDPRTRPTFVTLTGMRVMIVSSDLEQRKQLSELARSWRMLPHEADNAAMALHLLSRVADEEDIIPLVITSNDLPVQDGFLLAFRIKNNAKLKQTAVVMLAKAGKAGDAIACRESGISAYLRQPIGANRLNEALSAVMGAQDDDSESTSTLITRHSLREAKAGTVLLIDANRDHAMGAAMALKKVGYRISTADSATVAHIEMEQDRYDIIIIDPSTSGFAEMGIESIPDALRAKLPTDSPEVPILLALAEDMSSVEYGYSGTIVKPYDKEDLVAQVAKHMPQKAA